MDSRPSPTPGPAAGLRFRPFAGIVTKVRGSTYRDLRREELKFKEYQIVFLPRTTSVNSAWRQGRAGVVSLRTRKNRGFSGEFPQ